MKLNNILVVFAIIAIVIAIANISVLFIKNPNLKDRLTGYATGTGYVNLTVYQKIALNFTQAMANFSTGSVDTGETNATLQTNADNAATVTRGNWSTTAEGLILENIGNVNVTLTLGSNHNHTDLFNSPGGEEDSAYKWNVSNKEAGACINSSDLMGAWVDVNKTADKGAGNWCNNLSYETGKNEIYLDIKLIVPYDATNHSIVLTDTITATAAAAV